MATHEPLELLKLLHMVLHDVGADDIQLVQFGDGCTARLDELAVIGVKGLEIVKGVDPALLLEFRPSAEAGDRIRASIG